MRRELPTGTVTFLFTDIEGSTRLLARVGEADYEVALAEHRRVLREAFAAHGGVEVDTQGDSFLAAFPSARGALAAAEEAQSRLRSGPVRVRMAVHTGTPRRMEEGYVGPDLHRGARIAAAGHGGQVLVSSTTAALVDETTLRDLGEHSLRDLDRPERIFEAGEGGFPPLHAMYQTNLPVAVTPFVGRESQLAELVGLLKGPAVRLVTVTGAGGTGKTRLAIEAARRVARDYPDGVWWVPLAALRESALVIEAAAGVLGAGDDLRARIGDKRMLLLLDNFEQVIGAADDVAALLGVCPNLELLVTSRRSLHLLAEHEYEVPPLAANEAVELFITRARAARPDFQPDSSIAQLCARLDDLPLAIELAAARVKVLSPAQIMARLEHRLPLLTGGPRDLPERQRALRATIEWSYELLARDQQELFARLAVFRGGWTLEAAEEVAGATVDSLSVLVDDSLVRRRGVRYGMLETIAEYAAGVLAVVSDAGSFHRRHAEHYLALAEEAEPYLFQFSKEWLDRLTAEHDNLRAAIEWLSAEGMTQEALRLTGALPRFWIVRGHLAEGRRRLERLLERDDRPTAARGKALNGAALLAINTGDPVSGRRFAQEALDLHVALGEDWGTARSAMALGYALADLGELERARDLFEQSRAGFEALGDVHNVVFVTPNVTWMLRELGDTDRARALDEENLARARAIGNQSVVGLSLSGLGLLAIDDGRAAEAVPMMREAVAIDRDLGDVRRTVDDLCRLAHALAAAGEPETAATIMFAAEQLHAEIGASISPEVAVMNRRTLATIRARLADADVETARQRGLTLTFDDAYELALGG